MTIEPKNLYDTLLERGLVSQCTASDIQQRLDQPIAAYIGFDPTADSLHVGSLVPIMGLAWLQRCGHKPIVLIGGGTAMIGDPSGKSETRNMLDENSIERNANAIKEQLSGFLTFGDGPSDATMVNNSDWLAQKGWIEMLREIGPHFSINRMLTMESIKGRMSDDGISFLEFCYMILQAYDYLHLYNTYNCTLQMGGQDQWGNIVMGLELIRRLTPGDASEGSKAAGLTFPLVTKSDGGKFGKSETGNIWLDQNKTSTYDFYQFWRNTPDADVKRYLSFFTFLPMEEVERLSNVEGAAINQSKEILAYEVTALVHGEDTAKQVQDAAKRAFGSGDISGDIPSSELQQSALADGIPVIDLIREAGFAKSNGEARRHIQGGAIRVFDDKITDPMTHVTVKHAQDKSLLLRMGKKKMHRFDLQG